jgi:hypothetical protein
MFESETAALREALGVCEQQLSQAAAKCEKYEAELKLLQTSSEEVWNERGGGLTPELCRFLVDCIDDLRKAGASMGEDTCAFSAAVAEAAGRLRTLFLRRPIGSRQSPCPSVSMSCLCGSGRRC